MRSVIIPILLALIPINATLAEECHANHTGIPAPIGVMGEHLHHQGEWMFGYRLMTSRMTSNGHSEAHHDDGSSTMLPSMPGEDDHQHDDGEDLSAVSKVHGDEDHGESDHEDHHSLPSPNHTHKMRMDMHMLEAMYGITDDVNLMVMLPLHEMEMNHGAFKTRNEGVGDLTASALLSIFKKDAHRIHFTAGMSFPTGDIKDSDTYHGVESRHPYHMTLGSGTYDLLPALTYTGQASDASWGVQGSSVIRLGRNSEEYSLGNRYQVTTWGGYRITAPLSVTTRLTGTFWNDVDGMDKKILIKNAFGDPSQQAGDVLELGFGANYQFQSGFLKGHRLGVEWSIPLAQNIDAGQHELDWALTAGWLYAF